MPKETNREKAMSALIATASVPDAAKCCGLSETTLRRYLADAEFKSEYRGHKRDLMAEQIDRLRQAHGEAIETIRRNMSCENPVVEVRAAQIVIEQVRKDFEMSEMLDRIEALERGPVW